MNNTIKVGFCIAYDWKLLEYALPLVYQAADEIFLSIDIDRKTWANSSYEWDQEEFKKLIGSIDLKNKIRLYEDNFHLAELTTMENEVRQRNMMAAKMGPGGWHIQLDCDEYFIGFEEFVKYLKSLSPKNYKFNVCCSLVTLFKQVESGFLYIVPDTLQKIEFIQIATRTPHYQFGRRNGDFNIYTNFKIIHQSWARSEEEVHQKIINWGHNSDFDSEYFVNFWKSLNESNYKAIKNFHPLKSTMWTSLRIVQVSSMEECIEHLKKLNPLPLSKAEIFFKNSRLLSKIRQLFKI